MNILSYMVFSLLLASCSPSNKGRTLYSANCMRCHGANAEGTYGPNIQNKDYDTLVRQVKNGSVKMPKFDSLSEQDIREIHTFIKSIKNFKNENERNI